MKKSRHRFSFLKTKPSSYRSDVLWQPEGTSLKVNENGGIYKAGLIESLAVVTRGEALGHYTWLDKPFIESVVQAGNTGDKRKARYTHPDMSSDGLGTLLGDWTNFRLSEDGNKALADLHFTQTSRDTPRGDLGKYVMKLAEETPQHFGFSIVFKHDYGKEQEFHGANSDESGSFTSPDELNTSNLPHARLAELRAADATDSPAANASGAFTEGIQNGGMIAELTSLMDYVLGQTDDIPAELSCFDADPIRARSYVTRYLHNRGLELTPRLDSDPEVYADNAIKDQLTKLLDQWH